jgi:asparagine N-glycosylation enzyme membrane subunit Stt3
VAAGGVAYVLAAPVVAISGGAVIWQIIHIVRTTRRGEFRHPIR